MEKAKLNYGIDFLMFLSFLVSAISGVILWLVIPSGIQRGGQQNFLGFTRQIWLGTHNWFSLLLVILAIIHLILHWNWIVGLTKNLLKRK